MLVENTVTHYTPASDQFKVIILLILRKHLNTPLNVSLF